MAPRLLYVVTEDWYFLSHRLPMARAARAAGFEVHVATRVVDGRLAIEAEGFVLHPVPFVRGQATASLGTIRALRQLYRDLRPAIAHHVALQPVVLGSLAAIGLPVALVNALTGFGYSFAVASTKARATSALLRLALRLLLQRRDAVVLVQNDDDRTVIEAMRVPHSLIRLIPGSGIEIDKLNPLPEPSGPPTIAFVGRLLGYKGVRTAIAAQRLLRAQYPDVELLVAGAIDPANPDSLTEDEVQSWSRQPGVILLGHVRDIATVWARASIAVLPSHHEGLPKALLEAAACRRPMVATDVPGCRDIVRPGETGLLVPVDDPQALAKAIATLIASPELRARFGQAARRLAVEQFSADSIGHQTVELYRSLLSS